MHTNIQHIANIKIIKLYKEALKIIQVKKGKSIILVSGIGLT